MQHKSFTMLPFFVYGTLLPDQPNFYRWQYAIGRIQPATLQGGVLYDMGHYPMLIESAETPVVGALVHIEPAHYASVLTDLDALEDYYPTNPTKSTYLRVQRAVMAQQKQVDAWLYVGKPKFVTQLQPIGGDWVTYSAEQGKKLNKWWQAFNQNPESRLLE